MTTAREYLRVSKDKSGRKRSNQEQQHDNRAAWDFDFGDPYSDATSASRYARKARDDWPRLIADLETDTFGAEILTLWEGSRGSRKVGEWVTLLDLCEEHQVRIAVTEHDRIYDPAIPRDRKTLLEDAVDSEYESAKTSGRVRRGSRSRALAGRPHGPVLFGYRRVYDAKTGVLLGQKPATKRVYWPPPAVVVLAAVFGHSPRRVWSEADVVRWVFSAYAGGRSARSIAGVLNGAGIATGHGKPWVSLKVRRMLANVGYVGHRVHQGEDFGAAGWAALVDGDLFDTCEKRRQAAGWHQASNVASLLAGLVRCGVCSGRMAIKHANRRVYYGCQEKYCTYRLVDRLDAFVTAALLSRLARLDVADALNTDPGDDPAVAEAKARLAELKADLDEAMACWRGERPGRKLSAQRFAEMETHLLPQIAECERAIRAGDVVPLDIDLPAPDALAEWWVDVLDAEHQRAVMGAFIANVTVHPVGRGNRSYRDIDYTTIEWRR